MQLCCPRAAACLVQFKRRRPRVTWVAFSRLCSFRVSSWFLDRRHFIWTEAFMRGKKMQQKRKLAYVTMLHICVNDMHMSMIIVRCSRILLKSSLLCLSLGTYCSKWGSKQEFLGQTKKKKNTLWLKCDLQIRQYLSSSKFVLVLKAKHFLNFLHFQKNKVESCCVHGCNQETQHKII